MDVRGNNELNQEWDVVVGLETHAQLASSSKLFSGASAHRSSTPNAHTCFVDLAMPGMLPILNAYCVDQAIRTGLALGASINNVSYFDRKHYFYPDLPSGYQISQYYRPIIVDGKVVIGDNKTIRICRAHIEQDAGKSVHDILPGHSCIDFNRAGVALLEIVTEPDISNAKEAVEYIKKLQLILRYIGACSGDMEDGAMRCDANVSVKKKGSDALGVRCEIKNLNSITNLAKAIEYEAKHQIALLEGGDPVVQCTKLFDADSGVTRFLRIKEGVDEYGYFHDPDLAPLIIEDDWIAKIRESMPELPDIKKLRYCSDYGLSPYDADVLISDKSVTAYFEKAIATLKTPSSVKTLSNWITTELFGKLNKTGANIEMAPVTYSQIGGLVNLVASGEVSSKIAKQIFELMIDSDLSPSEIIIKHGLGQIDDVSIIEAAVDELILSEADNVLAYRRGKDKLFGYFVGKIMQKTKGQANPDIVNKILRDKLNNN